MSQKHWRFLFTTCILLVAVMFLVAQFAFSGAGDAALQWHIFWQLQLPLVATSLLVGAALTSSAASLQVVLRNPLADPSMIGISSGASLLAAVLILTAPTALARYFHYWLPLACFMGAFLSTLLIYLLSRRLGDNVSGVILAGIAISTVSGAIIGWLYWLSDAHAMRQLTFWLMGSLYQSDWVILSVAGPLLSIAVGMLWAHTKQLNLLYAGELNAQVSGIDVTRLTAVILVSSAVAVGCAVAVAGSIAFLGILVPHLLRLWFGHDNRFIIPASSAVGALLLMVIAFATEMFATVTLPVSMITATLGGPLLLWAIFRGACR